MMQGHGLHWSLPGADTVSIRVVPDRRMGEL
jgi:hypothetical protein